VETNQTREEDSETDRPLCKQSTCQYGATAIGTAVNEGLKKKKKRKKKKKKKRERRVGGWVFS
jgi:hypothetical protein